MGEPFFEIVLHSIKLDHDGVDRLEAEILAWKRANPRPQTQPMVPIDDE